MTFKLHYYFNNFKECPRAFALKHKKLLVFASSKHIIIFRFGHSQSPKRLIADQTRYAPSPSDMITIAVMTLLHNAVLSRTDRHSHSNRRFAKMAAKSD